MKASVSTVWFIGLVVTFLLVFSAYIIITVDYSKTFKLKNEVLTIVEKNKGMTLYSGGETKSVPSTVASGEVLTHIGAVKTINAFLKASGYDAKGGCNIPAGTTYIYGVTDLKYGKNETWDQMGEPADPDKQYYYCFAKYPTGRASKEAYDSIYYRVELFYRFEIPVLREFIPVRVDGITDEIYRPAVDAFGRNSEDYFNAIGG